MSKPVCVISEHDFVASIADALQYVAVYHPPSFVRALAEDYTAEDCPAARDAIAQILINSKMAAYGRRPICQDGRCQCVREDRDWRAHRQHASTVHDAVAEPFHELRTEFESLLAALEEQAPRPGRQSAYLCGISASVGFGVDRATAGGS
jgi:fumarate hydratase, class I